MRAVRRSPLFRIALLTLAVLFAQTIRANTQQIIAVCAPCPGKVAAAQPDPEKKLFPAARRTNRPEPPAGRHHLSSSLGVAHAYSTSLLSVSGSGQITVARWAVSIAPQRRSFALRI
jgi:hypothetical protein